jgi:siroheme synthase
MFMLYFFNASQRRLMEIAQQAQAHRQTEREVCAVIARGNVSLQRGEYITQEDMDSLQNELETFFSSKESIW